MSIVIGQGITVGTGVTFTTAAPPPPASPITGTFEVGQFFFDPVFVGAYGPPATPPGIGTFSVIDPSGIVLQIARLSNGNTQINFVTGTYTGYTVTDSDINGLTSITATVDGITQTQTLSTSSGGPLAIWAGSDVFSLASKIGQALNFSITVI